MEHRGIPWNTVAVAVKWAVKIRPLAGHYRQEVRLGWAGVYGGLARFPPPHLVQANGVFKALKCRVTEVGE